MYNNDVGMRIYEVKRHSNERHPLFYFINFTTRAPPLPTSLLYISFVLMNPTLKPTHPPIHR
jgi:hypothetical protein